MKILIVLTSHSNLGDTGQKTGFWIEEFATPYYILKDAGATITIASPEGGQPPIDPKSNEAINQTESTIRFNSDIALQKIVSSTTKLTEVSDINFDAVFFPGGHGPLWDLNKDKNCILLIKGFWKSNKPIATVCHSPAVLLNVRDRKGNSIVKGKRVTGFSNTEEKALELLNVVPFSLETELQNNGGEYSKNNDWESYAITDGMLITGQNPASSKEVAYQLLEVLRKGNTL